MVFSCGRCGCDRYGLWPIWLWPIWSVADMVQTRDESPPQAEKIFGAALLQVSFSAFLVN